MVDVSSKDDIIQNIIEEWHLIPQHSSLITFSGAIGFDWVTNMLWWRAVVDQLAT